MDVSSTATTLAEWGPTNTVMAVLGGGLILWCGLSMYQRRRTKLHGGPTDAGPRNPEGPAAGLPGLPGVPGVPGAVLTPHEELERMKQDRGLRRDLTEVAAEVEQFAKRLGTRLDGQATRLEALIRQADARIARLEQLAPGRADPGSSAPASAPPLPPAEGRGEGRPAPGSPDPGPSLVPDDPLARQVYQLADTGLGPADIAQKIGEHVGKVELILALRSV